MRWIALFPLLLILAGCGTDVVNSVEYREVVVPPMYGQPTVIDTTPVDVTKTRVYYY